jgi:DNA polymerase
MADRPAKVAESIADAERLPNIASPAALARAEAACTRCPLYQNATQVVPGEGSAGARIMFVGEQPGNDEDLAGKPFVGPAGRMLDKAVAEAGIDRKDTFVTNAVKHFKFEQRGKRRLHKKPNAYEIDRCRWWLDLERKLVKPELTVALGVTAARALAERTLTISKVRRTVVPLESGGRMAVTVHPSSLLRMPDEASRRAAYRSFVDDLRFCARALVRPSADTYRRAVASDAGLRLPRSTTTRVPTFTRSYKSSMSALSRRMQPEETYLPIEEGSLVPWMR